MHSPRTLQQQGCRTLSSAQHAFLEKLFTAEHCLTSPEAMAVFATDSSRLEGTPLAMVRPCPEHGEEQLQELLRWAHAEHMPVYPRARATNAVGGCVPQRPGGVVSTLRMNRLLSLEPENFVAVVQPGIVTGELQKQVERKGLFYPPDPASLGISTIGGNVATCAGGMRALKYGVTREWVLGCRAVLPGGEVLTCGGKTHKNVVGLDLTRLMVGSEGTLGILSEITLKLMPKPQGTASVFCTFSDMHTAVAALHAIFRSGMIPAALEFFDEPTLHCLASFGGTPWPQGAKSALLVQLDGAHTALKAETEQLVALLRQASALWLASGTGEEEEALWNIRRKISPASFRLAPDKLSDDATVPRGNLLAAITHIHAVSRERQVTILTFGHAGDGNLHVNIMHDASVPAERERALAAKLDVMHHILALEGTLSGEHGVGLTKSPYLDQQLGSVERRLMQSVKASFDPHGIMNPGKAY